MLKSSEKVIVRKIVNKLSKKLKKIENSIENRKSLKIWLTFISIYHYTHKIIKHRTN